MIWNALVVVVIIVLLIFVAMAFLMDSPSGKSATEPGSKAAEMIGIIVLIATFMFLIFSFASSWQ
tara:strand:- start:319 stop:513 length:195 start_codon:yes stop_codon:yes gene_type:complete